MTKHLTALGCSIEYQVWGGESSRPTLVLLHEGLGSVAMWRDFPEQLAISTSHRVIAYSRRGYGESFPLTEARTPEYMHEEGLVWLPAVLDALGVESYVTVGHSDGGVHRTERCQRKSEGTACSDGPCAAPVR